MRFALNIPIARVVPGSTASAGDTVRTMVRSLDAAGIDACLTSEHPAPSAEWLHNDPAAHDCTDPLTAFAYVAACSNRLRLFTNILVLPYRSPFLTAKAASTLQILSDNRLILGVGVGYMKAEFSALGVDYAKRGALTDEALELLTRIWRGGAVTGQGIGFDAPGNEPRPLPTPPPPLWVGGGSDRALERAARWGDGWVPYFSVPTNDPVVRRSAVSDMAHFGEKAARLRERRAELGRAGSFDLAVAPPFRPKVADTASAARFLDEVHDLAEYGANWIWTSLPVPSIEGYCDFVAWFGEEVVSAYVKHASAS